MRLAQLSRKVNVKPDEIRSFLKDEFSVELEADPNAKIDDQHVDAVMEKYAPEEEEVEEVMVEMEFTEETDEPDAPSENEDGDQDEDADEVEDEEIEEAPEVEAVVEEQKTTTVDEILAQNEGDEDEEGEIEEKPFVEAEYDENAELIKAPKVELPGTKVVGKIELPTKKEPESLETVANDDETPISEDELPTRAQIEAEIQADEQVAAASESDDAVTAALDAQMASTSQDVKAGKTVHKKSKEVEANIEEGDDENSIYKDKHGVYHFTREQLQNRERRLKEIEEKKRKDALKEKKQRHYQDQMESKKADAANKPKPKKKAPKKKEEVKEKPKGAWGKFLAWLND